MAFSIHAAFPGGNVIVENIENNTVLLRQDWRTSSQWWFYWHFQVQGAQGQTLRFSFVDGDVFTGAGPCVLRNEKWEWMGREKVQDNGFEYCFGPDETEVSFALCPSYVQADLNHFLARFPIIEREVLCLSEAGRPVEILRVPSRKGRYFVLLTARTHACEAVASFVLEGLVEAYLSLPEAAALRENVDLHAVPFIDADGVERGEQGKFRSPHDHNRDFIPNPLYNSTRALMEIENRGNCLFFLDLHCPWIRDGRNEELFFLGLPPESHPQLEKMMGILQTTASGPLRFAPRHTIMPDQEWYASDAPTALHWARETLSPRLATCLEIPYALAGQQIVTPQNARAFGRDLCRALALTFEF